VRIRRLELYGFKSFCDRTAFTFGEGISCVVGPNGSGKSNVVDALKWVIGEQSARSLRGADMQDVIFAGSMDRKPVGFAEVQLTLCVDEGEPFPGEYAALREVQVGRRLHRSGASEYLINQVKCRRRDVVDLFLDTGIGTNLYSFIEQGRVDKVVSATPPERRELIDEAAGISRYKQRRAEARSRLEATVQQLDRAADVADEMARRLAVLEKQVVKAARFRRLRARVRQRETFLSLVKYRGLAADRRALQAALREGRAEEAAARRGLMRREEDLRSRREEVASVDEAAGVWRDELAEHDGRLRELASQQVLQEQRGKELVEQAAAAEQEAERARVEAVGLAEQLAHLRAEHQSTLAALAAREGSDGDRRRAVEVLETDAQAARRRRDDVRTVAEGHREALAGATARRVGLEERLAEVPELRHASTARLADLEAELAEVEHARDEATAAENLAATAVEVARAHEVDTAAALEEVEARSQAVRAAHEARVADAMRAVAAARERLQALEVDQAAARRARDRAHELALRQRRQGRDAAVREQQQRGRAWVDAVQRGWARRLDQAQAEGEGRLEALDASLREIEADARRAGEEAVAQAVAQGEQQIQGVLGPLKSAARGARRRRDELRDDRAEGQVRQASVEARVASLQARLAEGAASDKMAPPLVDALSPEAAEAALHALGRRASLPAFRDVEGIVAAQARLDEGASVEVFWDRASEPRVAALEVPTLIEALTHFDATGDAARVAGSSERVDADGTVTLARGQVASPAARRLAWRRELDEAEEALATLTEAQATLHRELEAAEESLVVADDALADAEREAERARRQVRREAEERASEQVRAAVEGAVEAREEASTSYRAQVEAMRDQQAAEVAEARAAREQVEAALRGAADEALSVWEREAQATREAAEKAAEVAHHEAAQAVSAALAAAEGVRAAPLDLPDASGPRARREAAREATAEATARASDARQGVALARSRAEALVAENERVVQEIARLDAREASLQADLEALDVRLLALRAEGEQHQLAVAEAESHYDASARVAQDAARDLASTLAEGSALIERSAGQEARLEELGARVDTVTRQVDEALARRDQAAARGNEAQQAAEQAEATRAEVQVQRDASFDRLERERERSAELKRGMAEAEADLVQLQERLRQATAAVAQRVEQSTTVRAEIDALRQRLDDRYQVSLPGLLDRLDRSGRLSLEVDEAVARGLTVGSREVEGVEVLVVRPAMLDDEGAGREALAELEADRGLLQRMGEVHLGAMEEYEELATRHTELATQREDLEGSVQRLRAAIAKMNRTCRERFRDAFDRVNEHFQESYPQLLGGGAARLALTDDEDLLETGVEIYVQPPGKRLQSLSLLSGGEKAMTAIALLIALFRVRPSPFCVLDEVDAPLDERNGGRFNGMLRDLAQASQFVVITHNRKTMECADTLYGVSMTTPGVSSLVSVAL